MTNKYPWIVYTLLAILLFLTGCKKKIVNYDDFEKEPYVSIISKDTKDNVAITIGPVKNISSLWVKLRIEENDDSIYISGYYTHFKQPLTHICTFQSPEELKFYWIDQRGEHLLKMIFK